MRLQGRTALVSGAGGPMGRAVAERFARECASLVVTDISGTRLSESATAIEPLLAAGTKLIAERADITQAAEAAVVVAAARAALGHVDIVINIVGGIKAKTLFEPMVTMSEERWDATFALNTKGILHLTKLLAPTMVERQYGKIVNISSISFAGEIGNADYGAAKAAVASLTRTMAIELAPHVNVNCIAPGTIRTSVMQRMQPDELAFYAAKPLLKRIGEPADIANACLFLASDEASYITGEILAVSGGVWPAL
jgi:NAD(P)-dependent dehydrogenase (short-subunit alcohol dehydrogenase family)